MDSEREIAHLATQYAGTEINMIQDYKGVNKFVSFCLLNCFSEIVESSSPVIENQTKYSFYFSFCFCLFDSCLFAFIFLFTLSIVLFVLYLQVCFEYMFDWHNQLLPEKLVLPKGTRPLANEWGAI